MKIAMLDDYLDISQASADWSAAAGRAEITVFKRHLAPDAAVAALADFDGVCLLRERMAFPKELIDQLPKLKLILITGTANRSLDVEAATARGITIVHTGSRAKPSPATAELAWGLLLAVVRDIPAQDRALRDGRWQTYAGTSLQDQTLGILGLGRLGRIVASYGKLFGMNVIAWSPNLTAQAAEAAGATRVEKDELFAASDALSIHLVLGERSRGVVGARELQLMKPGAILINTSRGPIVDEDALVAALQSGRLRAGLDVFNEEPLPAGHRLAACPNAVLTPHLGYSTQETFRGFYEDVAEGLAAYLDGAPVRVLNPEVTRA